VNKKLIGFTPSSWCVSYRSRGRLCGNMFLIMLALLVISGCTNNGQVFDLGQTPGMDCIPGEKADSRIFGDTYLMHEGDREITITDISLVGADNMVLTDAVLVRLGPDEPVVGFGDWPLVHDDDYSLPQEWDNRIKAEGAIINPGEEWNLVFILTADDPDTSSTEAVKIQYKDARGKKYTQQTISHYYIAKNCGKVIDEFEY
jgi:hypothetical protein